MAQGQDKWWCSGQNWEWRRNRTGGDVVDRTGGGAVERTGGGAGIGLVAQGQDWWRHRDSTGGTGKGPVVVQ